jgi:hypothetical protein
MQRRQSQLGSDATIDQASSLAVASQRMSAFSRRDSDAESTVAHGASVVADFLGRVSSSAQSRIGRSVSPSGRAVRARSPAGRALCRLNIERMSSVDAPADTSAATQQQISVQEAAAMQFARASSRRGSLDSNSPRPRLRAGRPAENLLVLAAENATQEASPGSEKRYLSGGDSPSVGGASPASSVGSRVGRSVSPSGRGLRRNDSAVSFGSDGPSGRGLRRNDSAVSFGSDGPSGRGLRRNDSAVSFGSDGSTPGCLGPARRHAGSEGHGASEHAGPSLRAQEAALQQLRHAMCSGNTLRSRVGRSVSPSGRGLRRNDSAVSFGSDGSRERYV